MGHLRIGLLCGAAGAQDAGGTAAAGSRNICRRLTHIYTLRRIIMTPVKKTTAKEETPKTAAKAAKTTKAAAPKKEAAKKAVKAEAPKAAEAVKEEVVKAEAPKAETAKKAAPAKKAAAKKTAAPAKKAAAPAKKAATPDASVYVEFFGRQFSTNDVVEKAIAAYKADHKSAAVKTIEVYVKPEENAAYYVINGEGSDDYKIYL